VAEISDGEEPLPSPGAAQTKMKQFLIRLVRIYFGLGVVFGGLGILSYGWGIATQANCGDFGLVVGAMVLVYAVFGAAVRTFLWLPSLIHWCLAGPEPTFLQWFLPGLFITCGTSP
jgi:cytochrome c biogenesis protein CcdA